MGSEGAQGRHVIPPKEQFPRVGAHVPMVHRVVGHAIAVVVLVTLSVGEAVGTHMVGRRA